MSVELGDISGSHVFVTEDGLNGFTKATLIESRNRYMADRADTAYQPTVEALNEVIESSDASIIEQHRKEGRFLLAATAGFYDTRTDKLPLGIFYAHSMNPLAADQTISDSVTVDMWVDRKAKDKLFLNYSDVIDWMQSYLTMSKDNEDAFGVPVDRDTLVVDVNSGITATYGHILGTRAIAALPASMPDDLKQHLAAEVYAYYRDIRK